MRITHKYSDINNWFFSVITSLLENQDIVTIALPGGHSLDGWYASILAQEDLGIGAYRDRLRWCLVDERCVPQDSPERNDMYVWGTFLKPFGVNQKHFLCCGISEVDALEYSETIGTPDIAIFGLGPDGHIASLFPGHPLLSSQMEGYVHIFDAQKLPASRITLTVPSIQKISHTALFAVGPEKKHAFESFLNAQVTAFECPAKILDPDIIFRQESQ